MKTPFRIKTTKLRVIDNSLERMIDISFGALADPIEQQLLSQNLPYIPEAVRHFQLDLDAIIRLAVHGLLPDSQRRQLQHKLFKRIFNHVKARLKNEAELSS